MLIKNNKNPIYELQKKIEKAGTVIGIIDEDGKLETNDKIMYTTIENIYILGEDSLKKHNLQTKIMWGGGGLLFGVFITLFMFFAGIIKV